MAEPQMRVAEPPATIRLTVGQAVVQFLAAQHVERDGQRSRFFAGMFGILGHGNVAGIGQALHQHALAHGAPAGGLGCAGRAGSSLPDVDTPMLRYVPARNEQSMVHAAAAFAKARGRMATWACTSSIGPGATNMVTAAAGATVNRVPVLLLPSDVFATRRVDPALQQLEVSHDATASVNDCLRPVSKFFDRVQRPEQLASALLGAMRVLTAPADTGAVTIALPQDVQAEAHDWPLELLAPRTWRVDRQPPAPIALAELVTAIQGARRPLLVVGGGVHYSAATEALRALVDATGIPVGETQAGKGALSFQHPSNAGAIGATGTLAANELAQDADLVIGVGTRWSDFTTASRTLFQREGVQFATINVATVDLHKQGAMQLAVRGDAREVLEELNHALAGWQVEPAYREEVAAAVQAWDSEVDRIVAAVPPEHGDDRPTQAQVIDAVNRTAAAQHGVVVCAAGSLPGDLHKLWRSREVGDYHMEYGYSCMGYELPGAIGVALADRSRLAICMLGDGSWLMAPGELVTAIQERVRLLVVLIDNGGYGSISGLSESLGSEAFGTLLQQRDERGDFTGQPITLDLAATARGLGAHVFEATTRASLDVALAQAVTRDGVTLVHVRCDRTARVPGFASWWEVPLAQVSTVAAVEALRPEYDERRARQSPT